jgi:hypothetical protein
MPIIPLVYGNLWYNSHTDGTVFRVVVVSSESGLTWIDEVCIMCVVSNDNDTQCFDAFDDS